jgi:hypothetical protein
MEVSGQRQATATLLSGRKSPGTHWIGGWAGPSLLWSIWPKIGTGRKRGGSLPRRISTKNFNKIYETVHGIHGKVLFMAARKPGFILGSKLWGSELHDWWKFQQYPWNGYRMLEKIYSWAYVNRALLCDCRNRNSRANFGESLPHGMFWKSVRRFGHLY